MSPKHLSRRPLTHPLRTRAVAPLRKRPDRFGRVEQLEDRTVPAILPLDLTDVVVAGTAQTEGGPDVAMRPDGTGFVVVWETPDGGGGSTDRGVFFRRYDANWQPLGLAVPANTVTTNFQNHASVGIDAAGNFVVAWQSFNQAGATSGRDIYARRFQADGTPIDSAEFLVNTTTANQQFDPDIAVDAASGKFVIGWWGGLFLQEDIFVKGYSGITI